MGEYKHVISLGFFCSTSLELEKLGLRSDSGPFDWIISDFEGVINCIKHDFENFLEYENLLQYKEIKEYYLDKANNFHFYHDFSGFKDLKSQLPSVRKKYKRRIERFQKNIQEPTLLLRYIKGYKELEYIQENFNNIMLLLKSKNSENEIIFILNDDILIEKSIVDSIKIFRVKKDDNDLVARNFLEKNAKLREFLNGDIYDNQKRVSNIRRHKKNRKKGVKYTIFNFQRFLNKFKTAYVHNAVMEEK